VADTTNEQAALLQMILTLSETDPNLKKAWDAYQAEDMTSFQSYILASSFYRNNNSLARTRQEAAVNQPDVYKQDLESYKLKAKKRLTATGIQWTTATEQQAEQAYNKGLDDNQLDSLIIKSGQTITPAGAILGGINELKAVANEFGVGNLLGADYWNNKSTQLFSGTTTAEDIAKEIRNLSASAFPAYAEGIANGLSLDVQATNIKQTMATYLELDPDSISYTDPVFRQMLQYTDPVTGKPAIMPQWLAEKTVKSHPSWGLTKNARDTVDSLTLKVATDFFGGAI